MMYGGGFAQVGQPYVRQQPAYGGGFAAPNVIRQGGVGAPMYAAPPMVAQVAQAGYSTPRMPLGAPARPQANVPQFGAVQAQPARVAQQPPLTGRGVVQQGFGGAVGVPGSSAIARCRELLDNREQLKAEVKQSFQRVAGGSGAVDIAGLQQMRFDLAPKLGVPEQVFGPLEDDYIRFDFDGSGFLRVNEVYKLVKFAIYDYLKANDAAHNSIPFKSKQQAGIQTIRKLGEGNQASVDLVCDQHGNQRCLKTFNKAALMGAGSLSDLQDEFEAMQLLACRNIARSFEIFQDHQFVYMVNEVYHGGDFTSLKQKATAKLGGLTEDWWKGVFRQCFEALQFMHQQAVMHCDVKEPNLMLRTDNYSSPQVVLIDFGISKAMTKDVGAMVSGTPGYMPPETMNTGKWYPGGDVFSLGVTIFQLITDMVPDDEAAKAGAPMRGLFLSGCSTLEDVKRVVNTRQPQFQAIAIPGLRTLCQRVLEKNMRSRPRAPAVLKDAWFGGMAPSTRPEEFMHPVNALATVGIQDVDTSPPMQNVLAPVAMQGSSTPVARAPQMMPGSRTPVAGFGQPAARPGYAPVARGGYPGQVI